MKKRAPERHVRSGFLQKFLWVTCLLFALSYAQAQQETTTAKVSFTTRSVSLNQALINFKDLTGVQILFNEQLLQGKMCQDFHLVNVPVIKVLEKILEGSGFTCIEIDGVYVIRKIPEKQLQPELPELISGSVVDVGGNPLPGVTIQVKGTTLGVSTDQDGKFEIPVALSGKITLIFSFVGMETQEIVVTDKRPVKVVLKENTENLEEVVVTGVFERRAESFTGSATTITRKELLSRGNQNLIQSLKNLDPSLNISENLSFGSDPNRLPDMELRGKSSFPDIRGQYSSNPNLPLFILDGFETSLEKVIDLNINRIASVTLLKDAAAKAIYGSKAANGVMVIETSKILPGELRVNYNGSLNFEMPDLSSYSLCNAREKLDLEYQLGAYKGLTPPADFEKKELYYQNLAEVERGVNTDWLALPLRTGVGHKHALNFEVGSGDLRVGADLSYNHIAGVMKGSERITVGGGISIIYRYKKLLFRNQFDFLNTSSKDSPYGEFSQYARLNPYWRAYNEDGTLRKFLGKGPMFSEEVYNPMFNASINTTLEHHYTDYTNNTYLELNVNPDLKIVGRVGVVSKITGDEKFLPGSHLKFIAVTEDDFFLRGSYSQTHGKVFTISSDINLNYTLNRGKHILFANLGANIRNSESEEYTHEAIGFPNDKMDNIIFAKQYAENAKPTGWESIDREVGALLAVNYSYDDRYLADFSLRTNASSQFGSDNRWGTFWSAGLGWNVHNEKFFKTSKVVKQLRLRASMGYTGSQNFNSYQAMLLYNYFLDDSYLGFIGTYLEGLANSKLKWQQKFDTNYGIDINLWGKLNIKFDYYRAVTDNLLSDITTPPSLGFNSYKDNLGKILNTGYEFRVNYQLFARPEDRTSINLFVSGAANKNKIKEISNSLTSLTNEQDKLAEDSNKPFVRFVEGQSLNAIWAVRSKGIDPSTGKEVFVQPDGTITDEWRAVAQVVCGDTEPKIMGNLGFSVEYKGLSVSFTGLYRLGGYLYNSTLVDKVENAQLNYNVDRRAYYDAWLKEGDNVQFKSIGAWNKPTQATSRFVQKLNEFDFSSLSVGYDFYRFAFVKKCGLQRLQLMFNMNDMGKLSTVKIERGTTYPFARYCSFTLNLNF